MWSQHFIVFTFKASFVDRIDLFLDDIENNFELH